MTTTTARRDGRPWALTGLWIALMAPLSLGGGMLQEASGVDPRFLPLVMVGPAIAWLVCRLAVPGWFPRDDAPSRRADRWRPWAAAGAASAAFVATLWAITPDAAMVTPDVPGRSLAAAAVVLGMFLGSWCEEVGYRGVMYRAMAARCGTTLTVVVNGLFFGLCHLQYLGNGFLVLLFLGATILLDVVIAACWHGRWQEKVLVAAAVHAVANAALQLRGCTLAGLDGFLAFLVPMTMAALVAVVAGRFLHVGDLGGEAAGRRGRRHLPQVAP